MPVCRRGLVFLAFAALSGWSVGAGRAEDLKDPFLGDPAAVEDGKQIYRGKCVICHGKAGGRGPNLFATKLTDEQFLNTVINGRPGTLMPVFGLRLTPDEIWKIHAFLKATPGGL